MASSGPLPAKLTLLSQLPNFAVGCKVRFLGCVTAYNLSTGILKLQHTCRSPAYTDILALVDTSLLLDHLDREHSQLGAWVNVIGYIQGPMKEKPQEGHEIEGIDKHEEAARASAKRLICVGLQAVMLWSAVGVRLAQYEKAVIQRLMVNGDLANCTG